MQVIKESLKGIAASQGLAIAKAWVYPKTDYKVPQNNILNPEAELIRLRKAIDSADLEIALLAKQTREQVGDGEAAIFEAHQLILKDPELMSSVEKSIQGKLMCAEWALLEESNKYVEMIRAINDPYLNERAKDVLDVVDRVERSLLGIPLPNLSNFDSDCILVADELMPSEMLRLDRRHVKGLVFAQGSASTHAVLIAQSMGLPCVVGLGKKISELSLGQELAIDGETGKIWIEPKGDDRETLLIQITAEENDRKDALNWVSKPSLSKDGKKLSLFANVVSGEEARIASESGAEGIGLFRTEFLFVNRPEAPSEEEQFEAYRLAVSAMDGKLTIIRTLDAGGDKVVPYLGLPKEENPFLGKRAIRICLEDRGLFKTQLRALLRAAKFGKLGLLLPMISSKDEVIAVKSILAEVETELLSEGVDYGSDYQLGIMIEIPSAVIMADVLAKEVDFFSIGTNDLTQYTLAADRNNEAVQAYSDSKDPAVLRLIAMTVAAAKRQGIHVGVCGAIAGNKEYLPFFLGIGVDELSMVASQIPRQRKRLAELDSEQSKKQSEELLQLVSKAEIRGYFESAAGLLS